MNNHFKTIRQAWDEHYIQIIAVALILCAFTLMGIVCYKAGQQSIIDYIPTNTYPY